MNSSTKMFFAVVCALFALGLSPISFAQSQAEMNQDAAADLKNAERTMNSLYQNICKRYATGPEANPQFVQKFKKAQLAWIAYRDAHLEAIYPPAPAGEYGSVKPMCEAMIKAELTNRRIAQLREWVDGIEEGEVCAGTRPIKK